MKTIFWNACAFYRIVLLKPNPITVSGSKLVGDQLQNNFEPASVVEFGFLFAVCYYY